MCEEGEESTQFGSAVHRSVNVLPSRLQQPQQQVVDLVLHLCGLRRHGALPVRMHWISRVAVHVFEIRIRHQSHKQIRGSCKIQIHVSH